MDINELRSSVDAVAGIASALANHDPREALSGEDARALGSLLKRTSDALRDHVYECDELQAVKRSQN